MGPLAAPALLAAAVLASPCRAAANKKPGFPDPGAVARTARQGIEIGTSAASKDGSYRIVLKARFQHYNPRPRDPDDHFDPEIQSPKSVRFLPDGSKVYVNSLEGFSTAVFDPERLRRIDVIRHRFDERNSGLVSTQPPFDYAFRPEHAARPNIFSGKPVETELTHGGRFLWVSYYHRDFDPDSLEPSAVAVVDTSNDSIVAALPSGPIPKYLAASPDGKWLAMVHWGDNTVGFVDISGSTATFRLGPLVTVERRLRIAPLAGEKLDRDKQCGLCLRGAVFTADGKYLMVGRLSGGGIAVIDVRRMRYAGTVWGMKPTPRHLVLSKDGRTLYVSSNVGGFVSKFEAERIVEAAGSAHPSVRPLAETPVGYGARTIALSPDERWIYAAVNGQSKLAVLRASDLKLVCKIPVDSFPVGLAVSPDGRQVWVTSQGRSLRGGNSVSVYEVGVRTQD